MIKLISIENIQNDMILADDLFNQEGILYLNKGVKLSPNHIEILRSIDIHYIYIEVKIDQSIMFGKHLQRRKIVNREYNNALNSFKQAFEAVGQGKIPIIEELKTSLEPLIYEVLEHNDIMTTLRAIEAKNKYTFIHSVDVSLFSAILGKWMGYNDQMIGELSITGLLHDIGKSKTPIEILEKPTRLTSEEFTIMKQHVRDSYEALKHADGLSEDILMGILQHHERIDGTGYPLGIDNARIHPFGKIVAVADIFDALITDRVYRRRLSVYQVSDVLNEMCASHLDVVFVQTFIKNIANFFVGNRIKLNTGEVGEVVMINQFAITRPLVKCGSNYIDLSVDYRLQVVDVMPEHRFV